MKKRTYIIMIIVILIIMLVLVVMPVKSHQEYTVETIKVHRGDTLQGYAKEYAPSMNWQEYSYRVRELNDLSSGTIYAGDDIKVLKEVVE